MAKWKEHPLEEGAVLLLNKGKRGVLRVVFGRTLVILLLLVLQIFLLLSAFMRLGEYYYGSAVTASLIFSLVVVNKRNEDPAFKITWILLIFLLPVLGIPLYLYVHADVGHRLVKSLLQAIRKETVRYVPDQSEVLEQLRKTDPGLAQLVVYTNEVAGQPIYDGTDATYLPTGEAAFQEMLRQLEQAEKFIFLEYFIIAEGYMWGRILSILERKAKEGVEVRVLYDGTCVMGNLPYRYPKELSRLGIQCRMFAPPRPLLSTYYNNRDHRKIMVIDGKVAFTGGINLADEYINVKSKLGHWKDTAVMLTGSAVRSFTLMFLQMWSVESRTKDDFARYLEPSEAVQAQGYALPYGSSPFDRDQVAKRVYLDIINRATQYVHIMTPYLIIDHEMITALTFAAKRGVEVKLILPGIPDKKTIFAISRSYYRELMEGGVEIYEYTPGFIHGKMLVSDDRTAVVGSINFDYRSLYLHFECAVLLYGSQAVVDVERDMQQTAALCRRVAPADWKKGKLRRLIGWLLRPVAPLL